MLPHPSRGGVRMTKLDDRTIANMDAVLEDTCRIFPDGGDDKVRRYIAQKLRISAKPSFHARTLWKLWMRRWKARIRKLHANSSKMPRDTFWF
jgi:hypothetical protein